jgi:hypothetical protein
MSRGVGVEYREIYFPYKLLPVASFPVSPAFSQSNLAHSLQTGRKAHHCKLGAAKSGHIVGPSSSFLPPPHLVYPTSYALPSEN